MKFIIVCVLLLAAAVAVCAQAITLPWNDDEQVNDAITIKRLNSVSKKMWTAGENGKFNNMNVGDVREKFLVLSPPTSALTKYGHLYTDEEIEAVRRRPTRNNGLPEEFDARKQWGSCIHPIRDQARCGSCWAFSAVEALGDRFCIVTNNKTNVVLSPQDLVSCDKSNMGCNGGYLPRTWTYLKNTGAVPESCLPYVSGDGHEPACPKTCVDGKTSLSSVKFRVSKYEHIGSALLFWKRAEKIQTALMKEGPIQVAFTVYRDFLNYKSGIYHHVTGEKLGGHAVKLIGWGIDDKVPYWIIANSWSTNWGENGYFRILMGKDECGIESNAYAGAPLV